MLFAYAEKSGNLFSGFQMRQMAFDSQRRYLYYSGPLPTPDYPSPATLEETRIASSSGGGSTPASPPSTPLMKKPVLAWKKKVKIDSVSMVAREHMFILSDTAVKERDLFQLEFSGETRTLATGETPAPGPLLALSADMTRPTTREEADIIDDPNCLRELYDKLRDQFVDMRLERERVELAQGIDPEATPKAARVHTIQSPRGKNEGPKGSRTSFVLRMRNEFEFRRVWFIIQTVMGYDKLGPRPYRGLPPYDPRNSVTFAWIPMCVWHTFKVLDKAVIYTFMRGDLVGRSTSGELSVYLHGAYMCITHDMVMVLRDTGSIPRWAHVKDINEFYYNADAKFPYVAFITDPGAPDICFIPQPPYYGAEAIKNFSPRMEVLRLRHVVHETCFASLDIRRVIQIRESKEKSMRAFVDAYERVHNRRLDFDPTAGYNGIMSCPLPKEQLAQVWREVQQIYESRDAATVSQSAIPIYRNNTNDPTLNPDRLLQLTKKMARERVTRHDVVGVSYDEARNPQLASARARSSREDLGGSGRGSGSATMDGSLNGGDMGLPPRPPGLGGSQHRASSNGRAVPSSRPTAVEELQSRECQLQTPQLGAPNMAASGRGVTNDSFGNGSFNMIGNTSFGFNNESFAQSFALGNNSIAYGSNDACYLTQEDVEAGNAPPQYVVDHHTVMMSQTPMAQMRASPMEFAGSSGSSSRPPGELHITDVMSRSFAAMNASFALRNTQNYGSNASDRNRLPPFYPVADIDVDADSPPSDLET